MTHERYMHRCLQLAALGLGTVSPNPMVGAVLVHNEKIIGEGYHKEYGGSHAEVHCIQDAIDKGNETLIETSNLYVSLEPCNHFGKTPPCSHLIVEKKIPRVIIAMKDPFPKVNGSGIEYLKKNGVEVEMGILESEAASLNKRFLTYHIKKRPYIILKWAQSADGIMGSKPGTPRLFITSDVVNTIVHKWRSEEDAILIGRCTALLDQPMLTTRHWEGKSPLRVILDNKGTLPLSCIPFAEGARTIVLSPSINSILKNISVENIIVKRMEPMYILNALWELEIESVLIEGGANTLQAFIQNGLWDEARIITNNSLIAGDGLSTPLLKDGTKISTFKIGEEEITFMANKDNVWI